MADGISASFVKAWQSCDNPPLDGVNPHYGNRYASLKATLKVIRDACTICGLAYRQRLVIDEAGQFLVSDVMDESGESMELSRFPVSQGANPQAFGSALTYAKRQQAQADWGIAGEEDDDANDASVPNGPCNARCKACGSVWSFENGGQMAGTPCPKCGNATYEVV